MFLKKQSAVGSDLFRIVIPVEQAKENYKGEHKIRPYILDVEFFMKFFEGNIFYQQNLIS